MAGRFRDILSHKPGKPPPGAAGTEASEANREAGLADRRLNKRLTFECPPLRDAMDRHPVAKERRLYDVDPLFEYPFRPRHVCGKAKEMEPCTLPEYLPPEPCPDMEQVPSDMWPVPRVPGTSELAAKTLHALDKVDFSEAMEEMQRIEKTHPEAVAEAMVKKILNAIKSRKDSYEKEDEKPESKTDIGPTDVEVTSTTSETESESDREVPRSIVEAMVDRIWDAVLELREKKNLEEIPGETEEREESPDEIADKIIRLILEEVDASRFSGELHYPFQKLTDYYSSLQSEPKAMAKAMMEDVLKDVQDVVGIPGRQTADDLMELLLYKVSIKADESSTSEEDEEPRPPSPLTKHRPIIWDEEEKQFEIFWNVASPRGHLKHRNRKDDDGSSFYRFKHSIDCLVEAIKIIRAWREQRKAERRARKRAEAEEAADELFDDLMDRVQEPEIVAADILDNLVDKAHETEKMVADLLEEDVMDRVDGKEEAAIDILELLFGKVEEPEDIATDITDELLGKAEEPHDTALGIVDELIEGAQIPDIVVDDILDDMLKNVDSAEAVAEGMMDLLLEKISDVMREEGELLAIKRYREYEDMFPERRPMWSPQPKPKLPDDTKETLLNLQAATECWLINILEPERPLSKQKPEEKTLIPVDITGQEPPPEPEDSPENIVRGILNEICDVPLEGDMVIEDLLRQIEEHHKPAEDLFNQIVDDVGVEESAATDAVERMLRNLEEPDAVVNNLIDWVLKTQVSEPSAVINNLLDSLIKEIGEPDTVMEGLLDSILKHLNEYDNPDDLVANILDMLVGDVGEKFLAKFHLENDRCFSRVYKATARLGEILNDLASLCEVPKNMIVLVLDGVKVLGKDIFYEDKPMRLLRKKRLVLHFALSSYDDLRYPLRTEQLTEETPRIFTRLVRVEMDKFETRYIRVLIYDETIDKPFVGGYRNKRTGVEHHHAFTQTGIRPKRLVPVTDQTHRDTQTARLKHLSIETVVHRTQQMWRNDVYISPEYDYIITAKPYIDADEALRRLRLDENAAIIQRAWRRYLLRKYIRIFAYKYRICQEYDQNQQMKYVRDIWVRHQNSLVRKTYPRTRRDFDMWYALIEKWRMEETRRAHEMKDPAARKAALKVIFLKEVDILRDLEVHRTRLKEEKRDKIGLTLIDKCADPIQWTSSDGCLVSMDTVPTQKAREFRELYYLLARDNCPVEERIEILMNAKYALHANNTILSFQLTKLLERETEMLLAGVKMDDVDILRERIQQLFRELLKDPEFNPQAAKHILEYNTNKLDNTFHRCRRCHRLRKKVDSFVEANMKYLQHCDQCNWQQFIGSRRWNLDPYRTQMRAIRREEARRHCFSSVAFVMQDIDFFWLIDNLWHSQSFLTEKRDITEMRMVRWKVNEDWSPWNCILLTNYESKWHLRLPTLEQGYSQELMDEVHNRHLTAKLHFRNLIKTDKYYREDCKWYDVTRAKDYTAPSKEADTFL